MGNPGDRNTLSGIGRTTDSGVIVDPAVREARWWDRGGDSVERPLFWTEARVLPVGP